MLRLSAFFWILACLLILGGCSTGSAVVDKNSSEAPISSVINPPVDPEMAVLLDSYRDSLNSVMGTPVAVVRDTLRFGQPESALGNIVGDAVRFRAGAELETYVHVGIMGESSFKLYLEPGELTVGEVLDFMPYDNHLVILTLSGRDIADLADQVASLGGSPVSGLRFMIRNGRATGVLVNSEVLDRNESYLVATSSWAADGGDRYPALWNYSDRIDLDVSIRDLLVDYFRSRREVAPITDGRIRR
jgi:2',3'-cyclic-nucleotide 2'-phosphodiesterase (5'-nucleotidase family)